MNQPSRQIRQAHYKHAQGKKGVAPLIIIVIATLVIGAGVGGFLVFQEKKILSSEKTGQQEEPLKKTEKETQLPETRVVENNVPIQFTGSDLLPPCSDTTATNCRG